MVQTISLLTIFFAWLAVVSLPGTTSTSSAPPAPAPPPGGPTSGPTTPEAAPILLDIALESLVNPVEPERDVVPLAPPVSYFEGHRIVSVYGYPGICVMGELGCHDPQMAATRAEVIAVWYAGAADGRKPLPALHLIVDVAQPHPGPDGLYLTRMSLETIEEYVEVARERSQLLFLDLQIGWSDPLADVERLRTVLEEPFVHLALDPEFATRSRGGVPGQVIGTLTAEDVNRVQAYLAELVQAHGLPPKILVLHQFLPGMLPDKQDYEVHPEVEITVDMDGYGTPGAKISGYEAYALVDSQYPAFKLFFHWDAPLMTPGEVLAMQEPPAYIIYQ